jgi:hypothetical protein
LYGHRGVRAATTWELSGMGVTLVAAAAALAASLSRQMVPGGSHIVAPSRLALAVAIALVGVFVLLLPWRTVGDSAGHGLHCMTAGLLIAAPTAVFLWLLVRRGVLVSPGATGATAGMLAGLAGLAALQFGCAVMEARHVAVWHAAIPLLSGLVGFVLAKLVKR